MDDDDPLSCPVSTGDIHVTAGHCRDLGFVRCPRCWRWHPVAANHDHLCDRCCAVLVEAFPDHPAVPAIRASFAAQAARYRIGVPAGG